jgi:phospholipid transport system substrate-binding protein
VIGRRAARVLVLAAVAVAAAGAGPVPVTDEVRRSIDRVTAILADPALKGPAMTGPRRAALREVLDEAIDFPEAARRALGVHWRERTAAERAEFVALFKDLVANSYILRIEPYAGEKVLYTGESVEGDLATVRTRIQPRQGADVAVDYRVHRVGDRWLVYDVVVGGVSLVSNYRTQFNQIIGTSSYAELIARIRARLKEMAAEPAALRWPSGPRPAAAASPARSAPRP